MAGSYRASLLALACCAAAALPLPAPAHGQTPMTTKGIKGVWHWPKNTTIKLYVPPDPDAGTHPGRRQAIIDGIKSWVEQEPLKSQNIKIQDVTSDPGTDDAIKVDWAAAGTVGKDGGALPAPKNEKLEIGFGRIQIDRSVSGDDFAYNLGQHEGGHIFGLKHTTGANDVMKETVATSGRNTFSATDLAELKSAYTASLDDTGVDVAVDVQPIGGAFRYRYTTTWLGGGNLAVFQIDTHGAPITDIVPATGWKVDDFSVPGDVTQVIGIPRDELFLGFIHATDEAYLDAAHPVLSFEFRSIAPPGPTEAFLNGRFTTVGPTVPEPSTVALVASGVVVLGVGARRRRTRDWSLRRAGPGRGGVTG